MREKNLQKVEIIVQNRIPSRKRCQVSAIDEGGTNLQKVEIIVRLLVAASSRKRVIHSDNVRQRRTGKQAILLTSRTPQHAHNCAAKDAIPLENLP